MLFNIYFLMICFMISLLAGNSRVACITRKRSTSSQI